MCAKGLRRAAARRGWAPFQRFPGLQGLPGPKLAEVWVCGSGPDGVVVKVGVLELSGSLVLMREKGRVLLNLLFSIIFCGFIYDH